MASFSELISTGLEAGRVRAAQANERDSFAQAVGALGSGDAGGIRTAATGLAAAGNPGAAVNFLNTANQQQEARSQANQERVVNYRSDLLNLHLAAKALPEERRGAFLQQAFPRLKNLHGDLANDLRDDGNNDDASLDAAIFQLGGADVLGQQFERDTGRLRVGESRRSNQANERLRAAGLSLDSARLGFDEDKFFTEQERLAREASAGPGARKLTEGERKFKTFATLASQTHKEALVLEKTEGFDPTLVDRIPNTLRSDAGQKYLAAREEFVDSIIRPKTGAAATAAEREAAYNTYFPQFGDRPAAIEFKADLRRRAVEAIGRGLLVDEETGEVLPPDEEEDQPPTGGSEGQPPAEPSVVSQGQTRSGLSFEVFE